MVSFRGFEQAVVVDVEATGLSAKKDRIVSVAALRLDFSQLNKEERLDGKSFVSTYNPGRPIPKAATKIHGISDSDVRNQPKFKEEAQELRDFIGSLPVIAHNLAFDRAILSAEFKRAGVRTLQLNKGLCTMQRFQDDNGGRRKGSKLETVASEMGLGGRRGRIHDAEEDALLAAQIAAGYYCVDNGIEVPGKRAGVVKSLLWALAIMAGLALLSG